MACRGLTKTLSAISCVQRTRPLCTHASRLSNTEVRKKRAALFEEEKQRQHKFISRVEKIQVEYVGVPEECTLVMNKGFSTPYNCTMHIAELLMSRSALALVDGEPWDMHKPLDKDCTLEVLHFKEEDPQRLELVNQTFWRSCSFILGHILETAFQDNYYVELCSFPRPNVRSGSFVYDADLKLEDWDPTPEELRSLSRIGYRLREENEYIERLEVDASVALKMFEDNRFKVKQIPQIAAQAKDGKTVTLYKMADHIDISKGPLMSSTSLIGRYTVTAVHQVDSPDYGRLQRIQGVALPNQLPIHYWTYEFLADCGKKLNKAPVPGLRLPSDTLSKQTEEVASA